MLIALFTLLGVMLGLGYSEYKNRQERRERFRVMTFEKRLQAHQQAYYWCQKLNEVLNIGGNKETIHTTANQAREWWNSNCLLLDAVSRSEMVGLMNFAHLYANDNEMGRNVWSSLVTTLKAVVSGIGFEYLPEELSKPEELNEEMDTNNKVTTERTPKALSIRRLITHWLKPVWVTLAFVLILLVFSLVVTHFGWAVTGRFLLTISPVFISTLAIMYLFAYLIPLWPLETAFATIFIMFGIYLFASQNNDNVALAIRTYLSKQFNIDFFSVSMTLAGVLIALYAIYKQERKPK